MHKPNLTKFVKTTQEFMSQRSPEILTAIGITGMISTTVLAVRATPKALQLIEEAKRKQNRALLDEAEALGHEKCQQIDRLKPIETVKVAWKPYIPAVITGTFSVACLIGATSVNNRRNAALATAYKLSEKAFTEYKEKVVETLGEKKEKLVQEKVHQGRVEQNPVSTSSVIVTGRGKTLCYEYYSGRYFESDIEEIRKAVNTVNRRMYYDVHVSLSEFYDELDLEHTAISDSVGWNLDTGFIEINFSSHIADDGRPCIVVNYDTPPRYDFDRLL